MYIPDLSDDELLFMAEESDSPSFRTAVAEILRLRNLNPYHKANQGEEVFDLLLVGSTVADRIQGIRQLRFINPSLTIRQAKEMMDSLMEYQQPPIVLKGVSAAQIDNIVSDFPKLKFKTVEK